MSKRINLAWSRVNPPSDGCVGPCIVIIPMGIHFYVLLGRGEARPRDRYARLHHGHPADSGRCARTPRGLHSTPGHHGTRDGKSVQPLLGTAVHVCFKH